MAGKLKPAATEPGSAPSRRAALLALAAACLVALALRVAAFAGLGSDLAIRVPILDARWSLEQAAALLAGEGWGKTPFFMAPLYPHLLAPIRALFPDPIAAARAVQSLAGLATWLLAVACAWRVLGRSAAVGTGWILALAGPPLLYENLLLVDAWIALLMMLLLWRDPAEGGRGRAALAGGLAAAVALGRASYLLLGPLVLVRIFFTARRNPELRGRLIAAAVAWIAVLAPVAIQNAATGAPGTPVSTNGGINLYLGFHEGSRGGFHKPSDLIFQEDPSGRLAASVAEGRDLTPAEASRYWTQRAVSWISGNPGEAFVLEARKLGMWLGSREQPQIEVYEVMRSRHGALRWPPLAFGWFVALGTLGLVLDARRGGSLWRRWGFWLGLLIVCWLTSMLTFAVGRFRLPAWGLLSIPAGFALAELAAAARRGEARRMAWGVALVAAVLIPTLFMPGADQAKAAAFFHHSLAQRHLEADHPREALEELDLAGGLDPQLPNLHHTRGVALASLGRGEEALRAYEASLAQLGPHPKTLLNMGALYGRSGRHEDALRCLRMASRERPDDPLILRDMGVALWETGRRDEALQVWRRVLQLNPGDAELRRLLESRETGAP